jgi:hypothetical protein
MIIIPKHFSTTASEMIRFSDMLKFKTNEAWWGWRKAREIKTPSPYNVMEVFVIIGKMAKTIGVPPPASFSKGLGFWESSPYKGEDYEINTGCFVPNPEEFISIAEGLGCTCKKIKQEFNNLAVSAPNITTFAEIGYKIGRAYPGECEFENPTTEELLAEVKALTDYKYWR